MAQEHQKICFGSWMALQDLIKDLHWPEEEFAKHLDNRMQLSQVT